MSVDLASSKVTIRTRASGLLAKLAHDLEIAARDFTGHVELDGERWTAELAFPVASLRVIGVVRGGQVDRGVLSAGDVAEIERKLRHEVLRGETVTVRGSGDRRRGELTVTAPRGQERVTVALRTDDRAVSFVAKLSLARLGVDEVKGPLGAFKVSDEVEVAAWMVVRG